jgi:hypothetical protein
VGFTGSYVACRCPGDIGELEVLTDCDDGCEWSARYPNGWQVGQWPAQQVALGGSSLMSDVAEATGAPALMGYVHDSSWILLDAATDTTVTWRACLAREPAAATPREEDLSWLHLPPDQSLAQAGILSPPHATNAAMDWATRAGTSASREALDALFNLAVHNGPVDGLFFELLIALGAIAPTADHA